MLGQAGGEVGVVVLNGDRLDAVALERVPGREVVRVEVVDHHLGRDREEALEVGDALLERAQRLPVVEVADVVPHPGTAATRQAEGALELGAAGQQRARGGYGRSIDSGTRPRERRMTIAGPEATGRTTESSVRVAMGRSCTRKRSAMPARRSSASSSRWAIGSSDTLPLVITSGPPASPSSRWCRGE